MLASLSVPLPVTMAGLMAACLFMASGAPPLGRVAAPRALPPVAQDDSFTRSYAGATGFNILSNDQADASPLDAASVLLIGATNSGTSGVVGTGGTFSVSPAGLVSVTVPAFSGPSAEAAIRYTVQDQAGAVSNPATLQLTLTNAAPQAQPDAAVTATNTPVTVNVTDNDTDADGNATLRPASVVLTATTGSGGGGSFLVGSNGLVTFTPTPGFSGTTTTSYTVADELGRRSAPVLLSVSVSNAPPVAARDVTATLAGTPVQIAVLNNDSDPNGYATLVPGSVTLSPADGITAGGTFSVDATTGVVTFTPAAGSTGATIGYRVRDTQGALSNSANLTVNVVTGSADVEAILSGPAFAPAGSFVEYTLTLTNRGSTTASSVQGRIRLPEYQQQVTASYNAVYLPATGLITFPPLDLAAAATRVHTVRFLMPATTPVSATGFSSANTADAVLGNNNGTSVQALVSTSPTQVADVVAVATGPARVSAGGSVNYRLLAVNYGPSVATDVTLSAQLPAGLTGVSVSDGGSYDAGSGRVSLPPLPALAALGGAGCLVSISGLPAGTTLTGQVWASATTAGGDPAPTNNDGSSPLATVTTTITGPVPSSFCASPATLVATTSGGQLLNTYYPGQGTTSGTNVQVGPALAAPDAAPIQAGDLVLIMQMQGAELDYANTAAYGDGLAHPDIPANGNLPTGLMAGLYEFRYVTISTVTPAGGGMLVLASPLTNTYTNAEPTATGGARRYQVLRVPRYRQLTLGADIIAAPWNGRTGGVLALDVSDTLNLAGYTLDARGRGFRGGGSYYQGGPAPAGVSVTDWVAASTSLVHASKGEGLAGCPRLLNNNGTLLNTGAEGYPGGSLGRGAPGNAGGGGTDGSVVTNQNNTGGGGGSNGGFGGQGGNAWYLGNATGGNGGAPVLAAHAGRVVLGGGGGAGATNNGTGGNGQAVVVNNGFNSSGAAGGGIVVLCAGTVVGPGEINVSGTDVTLPVDNDGGGGGGAGGSVVLLSSGSLTGVTVLANGGRGGDDNLNVAAPHGPGGGGAAGVVFASGPLHPASQALPGANGLTGSSAGPDAFGATPGTQLPTMWRTDLTPADVPLPPDCQFTPLPVTLTRFEATPHGNTVLLTWSTAQEINSARFEVERSTDGQRFARIGSRPAAGYSATPHSYSFTDSPLVRGALYYRLRQVDQDSSFTITPVRVVYLPNASGPEPRLYPNPAQTTVTLDASALPAATYSLTLVNLLGQELLHDTCRPEQPLPLSIRHLPPGLYLLQLTAPGYHWSQRLLKY